jgi:hypothetical protein
MSTTHATVPTETSAIEINDEYVTIDGHMYPIDPSPLDTQEGVVDTFASMIDAVLYEVPGRTFRSCDPDGWPLDM